jgi:hypothetical protein
MRAPTGINLGFTDLTGQASGRADMKGRSVYPRDGSAFRPNGRASAAAHRPAVRIPQRLPQPNSRANDVGGARPGGWRPRTY